MVRGLALLLTLLTGFSGLVYEVTWQKYLATLLGSHSEATAAVLGLFLGGLALGYALFGHVTRRLVVGARAASRPPRLLVAYGAVEARSARPRCAFPSSSRSPSGSRSACPWAAAPSLSASTSPSRPC